MTHFRNEDVLATATFIAAAPAVAEALAELYQFTYKHCQFVDADPILFKARGALLSAGYQFAPNDPVC